ncbi:hypothetical protein HQ587_03565 [bacterium]|nr:hypothetical protein [bacterium]
MKRSLVIKVLCNIEWGTPTSLPANGWGRHSCLPIRRLTDTAMNRFSYPRVMIHLSGKVHCFFMVVKPDVFNDV